MQMQSSIRIPGESPTEVTNLFFMSGFMAQRLEMWVYKNPRNTIELHYYESWYEGQKDSIVMYIFYSDLIWKIISNLLITTFYLA